MIPEELIHDLKVLGDREFVYEVVEDASKIYVVFKDFAIPSNAYNLDKTELLIFTTLDYPNAGFDMFWTDEKLMLKNGGIPKQAEFLEIHLGIQRRRFSYHPYNDKPWNPSEDDIIRFVEYVQQRFRNGD